MRKRTNNRLNLDATIDQAKRRGCLVFVFATANGFTIDRCKPIGFQDYYKVNGETVELVECKLGS